jgi:hypothetical protein
VGCKTNTMKGKKIFETYQLRKPKAFHANNVFLTVFLSEFSKSDNPVQNLSTLHERYSH